MSSKRRKATTHRPAQIDEIDGPEVAPAVELDEVVAAREYWSDESAEGATDAADKQSDSRSDDNDGSSGESADSSDDAEAAGEVWGKTTRQPRPVLNRPKVFVVGGAESDSDEEVRNRERNQQALATKRRVDRMDKAQHGMNVDEGAAAEEDDSDAADESSVISGEDEEDGEEDLDWIESRAAASKGAVGLHRLPRGGDEEAPQGMFSSRAGRGGDDDDGFIGFDSGEDEEEEDLQEDSSDGEPPLGGGKRPREVGTPNNKGYDQQGSPNNRAALVDAWYRTAAASKGDSSLPSEPVAQSAPSSFGNLPAAPQATGAVVVPLSRNADPMMRNRGAIIEFHAPMGYAAHWLLSVPPNGLAFRGRCAVAGITGKLMTSGLSLSKRFVWLQHPEERTHVISFDAKRNKKAEMKRRGGGNGGGGAEDDKDQGRHHRKAAVGSVTVAPSSQSAHLRWTPESTAAAYGTIDWAWVHAQVSRWTAKVGSVPTLVLLLASPAAMQGVNASGPYPGMYRLFLQRSPEVFETAASRKSAIEAMAAADGFGGGGKNGQALTPPSAYVPKSSMTALLSTPNFTASWHDDPFCCLSVVGPQGAGKSSMCRFLTNVLLSKYGVAYWAELDLGQGEFTPAGTISLSRVTSPLLSEHSLRSAEVLNAYYVGVPLVRDVFSLARAVEALAADVTTLRKKYQQPGSQQPFPLLVNTHGWIHSSGRRLTVEGIMRLGVTHVLQLHLHDLGQKTGQQHRHQHEEQHEAEDANRNDRWDIHASTFTPANGLNGAVIPRRFMPPGKLPLLPATATDAADAPGSKKRSAGTAAPRGIAVLVLEVLNVVNKRRKVEGRLKMLNDFVGAATQYHNGQPVKPRNDQAWGHNVRSYRAQLLPPIVVLELQISALAGGVICALGGYLPHSSTGLRGLFSEGHVLALVEAPLPDGHDAANGGTNVKASSSTKAAVASTTGTRKVGSITVRDLAWIAPAPRCLGYARCLAPPSTPASTDDAVEGPLILRVSACVDPRQATRINAVVIGAQIMKV